MTSHHPHFGSKKILLTGAAGVVGQALLAKLSNATVFCLAHNRPVTAPNAISLTGDIARPQLGLTLDQFDDLSQRIDCIIHAAAITDFSQPEKMIHRTNVEGTKNVLELAAAAGVPIFYISTAFTHVFSHTNGSYQLNSYETSKREAEQVVKTSGLSHVIVRPSIVVGNSRTGAISRFQGLHHLLGLFVKGFLPVAPASPHSYVDFVPQDWVADSILALIEAGTFEGEYWLTAGNRALRLQEVVDICIEHAPRLTGHTINRPRMVSPDLFERLIQPVFLPALPPLKRQIIEQAMQFVKYLNLEDPLPSSLAELKNRLNIPSLPNSYLTLVANLESWAKMNSFAK